MGLLTPHSSRHTSYVLRNLVSPVRIRLKLGFVAGSPHRGEREFLPQLHARLVERPGGWETEHDVEPFHTCRLPGAGGGG